MGIAIGLLFFLTILTVVGHGLWIALANIFGWIIGHPKSSSGRTRYSLAPGETEDLRAFRRVLNQLHETGKISLEERIRLGRLPSIQSPQYPSNEAATTPLQPLEILDDSPAPSSEPPPCPATNPPPLRPTLTPEIPTAKSSGTPAPVERHPLDPEPILAELVTEAPAVSQPIQYGAPAAFRSNQGKPRQPKQAMGEILQSFLASKNIRWGELIAGALIVVCSVGLVISLWNTMQQTHRLLPSIVFLLGTAGVEAAGLYTLRKWNLKDTSRAVLIIATLLIPLNIVAGIALATGGDASVGLLDPITLAVIAIATVTYTVMLWFAGTAIFGRASWQLTLAVGGPSFLMPFVPAAIRQMGMSAAWLSFIPATVVAIASVARVMHMRKSKPTTAASWRFVLLAGIALYSLAVAIGFMAFKLPHSTPTFIKLAFGTLPAVLAFMACGGELRHRLKDSRSDTLKLIATSTILVTALIVVAMFPVTLGSQNYLVAWSMGCALVSTALAVTLRNPKMLYVACTTSGIGLLLCGANALAGTPWNAATAHWRRLFSGESVVILPMLVGLFGGIAASLRKHPMWSKPPAITAGAAAFAGAIIAAVVANGPQHWNGSIAPAIIVAILLANAIALATIGAWKIPVLIHAGILGLAAFSVAMFQPELGWLDTAPVSLLAATKSMCLLLFCCLGLATAWQFTKPSISGVQRDERLTYCWQWTFGVSLVASALSLTIVSQAPWLATLAITASSTVWIIGSVREENRAACVIGQLLGILATGIAVHAADASFFVDQFQWKSGAVFWRYSAIIGGYVVLWHLLRMCAGQLSVTRGFVSRIPSGIECELAWTDAGIVMLLTVVSLLVAGRSYASGNPPYESMATEAWQAFAWTPLAAIALLSASLIMQVFDRGKHRFSDRLRSSAVFLLLLLHAAVVWLSVAASSANLQLITATCVALCLGVGMTILIRRSTLRGILFAASLEKSLWPINLMATSITAGFTLCVLAVWGVWQPLLSATDIDLSAAWTVAIASLAAATLLSTCSIWYRKRPLAIAASGVALFGITTAGATLISHPELLAIQTVQLIGCGCFALVLAQRMASRFGVISRLETWCSPAATATAETPIASIANYETQLWPSDWPIVARGLATIALATNLVLAMLSTAAHAAAACNFAMPSASGYGSGMGLGLLVASIACWMLCARRAKPIIDTAVWFFIAAPILADLISARSSNINTGWSSMLVIWSVANLLAVIVSFVPQFMGRRAVAISLTGSGLLIATGIISAIANVPASNIWLAAWGVGTLTGLAITIRCGDLRTMRRLSGVPVFSGMLLIFALYNHARPQWTQMLLSGNRITVPTLLISWFLACGIAWRLRFVAFKRAHPNETSPFRIDSLLLWLGTVLTSLLSIEVASSLMRNGSSEFQRFGLPLWLMLSLSIIAMVVSSIRWDTRGQLSVGYMLAAAIIHCGVGITASNWLHGNEHLFSILAVALGLLATIAAWLWPLHIRLGKLFADLGVAWKDSVTITTHRELSGWLIASLLFAITGTASAILREVDVPQRWMWIGTIIACSISIGRIGGSQKSGRMRTLAVSSLCAAAMFGALADVRFANLGSARPLVQCMRLFIASVWLIPLVAWVAPRALALDVARWGLPIRRSAIFTAAVALLSLAAIFVQELVLRTDGVGIPSVPNVLVIGTSLVIGLFSLLAMAIAVRPGKFLLSAAEKLTDTHRQWLVYVAQVLMLLAIGNKFLCQPSTLGIREYWPYMVMGFAFFSAGVSAWAQKRKEDVLLTPFRNSAIFLPLIPIIGFWLTSKGSWIFGGSEIQYSILLLFAAIFYLSMSVVWPGDRISRTFGIIAANAALWVTLTQQAGWGFLEHPQLWIIPPAACVLAAVHFERHRLKPAFVTACRYAATLVIYISSTADMLVQQIGSNIAGPIVLILLAFVGVAAGIVLRVRAFLYLGASFIAVGLVSMVWHAGKAIDQVWPWWAFGITTGLLLLGALMAIEKNKDSLRRLSDRLNQWEA